MLLAHRTQMVSMIELYVIQELVDISRVVAMPHVAVRYEFFDSVDKRLNLDTLRNKHGVQLSWQQGLDVLPQIRCAFHTSLDVANIQFRSYGTSLQYSLVEKLHGNGIRKSQAVVWGALVEILDSTWIYLQFAFSAQFFQEFQRRCTQSLIQKTPLLLQYLGVHSLERG